MIKIELQFETGAEARQALTELLGEPLQTVEAAPLKVVSLAPQAQEETTAPVQPIKKRRTKAEIEEAKKPDPNGDVQNEPKVTVEDLQKKMIELGRAGKKEDCRAILKKYGASSISSDNKLDVGHYADVLAEFNEL